MTSEDTTSTPSTTPGRLPTHSLLLGAGGALLVIGALLPWVSIAGFLSISGVDSDYGLIALLAAVVALVAAFGVGRIFPPTRTKPVAIAAAVLGGLSLAAALYVGFAIRDSVAEDESGGSEAEETTSTGDEELDAELEDFGRSLAEAFRPKTGAGVYVTAVGGLLVLTGAGMALMTPSVARPD